MMCCSKRDLRVLAIFARGANARLVYFLQPGIPWLDKTFSEEEHEIFGEAADLGASGRSLIASMASLGARFRRDMAAAAAAAQVRFRDLNEVAAFRDSRWLFVDPVHLNDAGNALVTDLIRQECAL